MTVRVSPLFVIMGLFMLAFGLIYDYAVFLLVALLHELVHGLVAYILGYKLDKILLTPSGASIGGDFIGIRPRDEALIAISGPLFNLLCGLTCVALWWVVPSSYRFLNVFAVASFVTFVFNLLPIFPLDGGRFLLAVFSKKYPRQIVYAKLRIVGIVVGSIYFIFSLVVLFFVGNLSIVFMSSFALMSTIKIDVPSKYTRIFNKTTMSKKLLKGVNMRFIAIDGSVLVVDTLKMLHSNYITHFIVLDSQLKSLGTLTEQDIDIAIQKYGYTLSCKQCLQI